MPETPSPRLPERDRPWMMRTYAGHSDAKRSNELYRRNLAKGQTGLSVAFTPIANMPSPTNPVTIVAAIKATSRFMNCLLLKTGRDFTLKQ